MQKLKEIVYVPISKVVRDENQPRQYFDAHKLGRLSESIKKLGIKEPLTVEALPDGTYKIVDGERRWRSAQAIGLKEVPVLIEKALSPSDRVIEQFHLQEMREGWQADEKAIAINSLAQVLDIDFNEAAAMVGLSTKSAQSYKALMSLTDRKTFISHRLPLERAGNVTGLVATAKNQIRRQLDTEMTDVEVKNLEKTLVHKLVSGDFKNGEDFRVLRDAIVKDAKNVQKFVAGKTPGELFNTSDAGGVRAYRHLKSQVVYLMETIKQINKSKDAQTLLEEDTYLQANLKNVIKKLTELV